MLYLVLFHMSVICAGWRVSHTLGHAAEVDLSKAVEQKVFQVYRREEVDEKSSVKIAT